MGIMACFFIWCVVSSLRSIFKKKIEEKKSKEIIEFVYINFIIIKNYDDDDEKYCKKKYIK